MRKSVLLAAIAFSLLCGAALTVLVALTCSVRTRTLRTRLETPDALPPGLAPVIPQSWVAPRLPTSPGALSIRINTFSGPGLEIQFVVVDELIPGWDKFDVDHFYYARRAGWPFYALECSTTKDAQKPEVVSHAIPVPSWIKRTPAPISPGGLSLLPLKPIAASFAADTALYAAATLTIILATRRLSRTLRTLKGRCTHCAYDRAGLAPSAPCPECGTAPTT